jgi:hypothetical protein
MFAPQSLPEPRSPKEMLEQYPSLLASATTLAFGPESEALLDHPAVGPRVLQDRTGGEVGMLA